MTWTVPPAFAAQVAGRAAEPHVSGDDWLARLPRLVTAALDRWELALDGAARWGRCAVVLPVRRSGGDPAALKLGWPHAEARHEHLALRAWGGRGAVSLLAAYPADDALLLERLDAEEPLTTMSIEESCTVLGGLMRTLDVPAFPQLDRLSDWTAAFLGRVSAAAGVHGAAGVPRRFLEQARALARDLTGEPGLDARLIHADLHDANVLRGQRAGRPAWLAIYPKPLAGQWEFAVAPALLNRWPDAVASGDVTWDLRCRMGWLCEAGGLDEDRAKAWTILRTVSRALEDGGSAGSTTYVAVLKAMQPD